MGHFSERYLREAEAIMRALDVDAIEKVALGLRALRERRGRLFIIGVGGSAGHASHAVNDFRKICGIEAYTPTDNVSELTARINDDGWDNSYADWLSVSQLCKEDAILVFSVGGGDATHRVSVNLVRALEAAQKSGSAIFGVVGRDGGYTRTVADACVVIPPLYPDHVTVHTEGLCAVVWHLLVCHPALQSESTKWESMASVPV